MVIIDNFYPQSLIDPVVLNSISYEWKFDRSDKNDDVYWTISVYGYIFAPKAEERIFSKEFKFEEVKNCWEFIKNKFQNKISDKNLSSCYFNGLTYGTESHAHIDSQIEKTVTIICYVCEAWNSHWGGETCFYNMEYSNNPSDKIFYSHEIIKSVLPRYNRIVIFDGSVVHSVRQTSKCFKGIRKTLMFKLIDVDIKELNLNAT
jgi:Rps23 Pro-64 3,4-dihydroxylase Tpa1-like proline 4-hydroxylase